MASRLGRRRRLLVSIVTIVALTSIAFASGWFLGEGTWLARSAPIVDVSTEADAKRLLLTVGSCNADHAVMVDETEAGLVTVTVKVENDTKKDCLDGLTILLQEPLADRSLIDGSTGEPVQVNYTDLP